MEYIPALALGFFGGFHCVGMCGGLVASFSLASGRVWKPGVIPYQLSRISTYVFLGAITAFVGNIFIQSGILADGQRYLSFFAGVIMILLAMQVGGVTREWFSVPSQGEGMLSTAYRRALKGDTVGAWIPFGILNGLLPCGLVYSALAMSLETASPMAGGFIMLAFGLGTLPWLIAVIWLMKKVTPSLRLRFTKLAALAIAVYGIFLMYKSISHGTHSMMHM